MINLLWFNAMHYSSLFQYFFWSTTVPTLEYLLMIGLQVAVN